MWYNNQSVEVYKEYKSLKRHQIKMIELLNKQMPDFEGSLLEIGCASGIFINALKRAFPKSRLEAIEYNSELAEIAQQTNKDTGIVIKRADAANYMPGKEFDAVIASGVLSIFEEFDKILDLWLSWLKPSGSLILFNRFNSAPVDVLIRHRSRRSELGWESGLNTFSIFTVSEYLESKGLNFEFERFILDIDIPKTEDPIRSYTMKLEDGSRIVVSGANLINEHYFLRITV